MKKFIKYFIILLAISTIYSGCKKDDDEDQASDYVKAKIDGVLWESESISSIIYSEDMPDSQGEHFISFNGNKGNSMILLSMPDTGGVNTYDLMDYEAYYTITYLPSNTGAQIYIPKSGTFSITEQTSDRLSGTFQFTGEDDVGSEPDIQITEGQFSLKYK